MEQKEMLALLKSQMHMTYAERNEIAIQLNALAERLHQQEADIEKLVQESVTMKASSPTMEWISVEDEPIPGEQYHVFTVLPKIIIKRNPETGEPAYWMRLEPPQPKMPTFKDVFLEAFPKTKLLDGGTPVVCAKGVFPQIGDFDDCCNGICRECWDQPYFEPEEEGEADA